MPRALFCHKSTEIMADDGGGRKLGLTELMYEYLTNRFNSCMLFQAAVLRSNHFLTVDQFIESLKILINFQPFLRMKVVKERGLADGRDTYFFRPCEVDDIHSLLRVRKKSRDEDWVAIINEEEEFLSRAERFGNGPQWRVVLSTPEDVDKDQGSFYTYDVVFIMQHMFTDGVSCYDMVYRQLLPILNSIINKKSPDERFLYPLQLTPGYEEEFLKVKDSADTVAPWYITLRWNFLRAVNRMFKERLYEPLFKSEGSPYNEDGCGPYATVIQEDLLEMLLTKRKEKNVTIHSMLLTALSFAILKLFQNHKIPLPNIVRGGWPIDSRKFNSKYKSPQPLGILTCSSGLSEMKVPHHFEASREMFWLSAKSIEHNAKMDRNRQSDVLSLKPLTMKGFAYLVENLKTVENYGHFFGDFDMKLHFVLSNLGKCSPGPELNETSPSFINAEELYFGICGKGHGAMNVPIFVTAINHKNRIFLANCYNRKWISKDYAREYMDYVEELLVVACREDCDTEDEFEHIDILDIN